MQKNEIPQVGKLHNALAYFIKEETQDEYWDFDTLSEANINMHIETFMNHPERRIFVAKENETLAGFIATEIVSCHLPISSVKRVGYISGAYVLPVHRGKGIMKRLDALAKEHLMGCGVKYIEVNFISDNTVAKKTWEALGYKTFREQARKRI